MNQRRILITGATGGLGVTLVREACARGHQIRATGRSIAAAPRLEALGAQFMPFDLEDPDAKLENMLEGCDSVIHAAALSASWGPHDAFVSANVTATRRLLDEARHAGVKRFVFVSSPSIFARFKDQIGIGEATPPNPEPLNFYAATKLEAERCVLAASTVDMATCAIRPRALVGEGDRVILPKLAELARRKRMPLPGGGEALIELTDLRDAAFAICEAEERATILAGMAINISGGHPLTIREVAQGLATALGTSPRLVSIPRSAARLLAHTLEWIGALSHAEREPALTRYTLATLAYSQTFDPEPSRRLLDYTPRYDALKTLLVEARNLGESEVPS